MPQFHTDTLWHSSPIFLWIPVDSNSLPLLKEALTISETTILVITMRNTPFSLAGTTDICCSGAGLEQLKQENQNSSQGEEYERGADRHCYPGMCPHWIQAVRQSQTNLPKGRRKLLVIGNPMPPQKIVSFGKSESKHIFGNHSSSPENLLSENCRRWCPPTLWANGMFELSGETQFMDRSHINNCNSILRPAMNLVFKAICHKSIIETGAINRHLRLVLGTLSNFTPWFMHRA